MAVRSRPSAPILVMDVAETLGYWMPVAALVDHVCDRFDLAPDTVRRAITRLIADGQLRTRPGWTVWQRRTGKTVATTMLEVRAAAECWEKP